jgi:hypothetical protein
MPVDLHQRLSEFSYGYGVSQRDAYEGERHHRQDFQIPGFPGTAVSDFSSRSCWPDARLKRSKKKEVDGKSDRGAEAAGPPRSTQSLHRRRR